MPSSKSKNKLYFFILCKDYSYCVPSRDLRTVDPLAVQVGDEISFQYRSLTLSGIVKFISESEKEVASEIKKEKRAAKLKQEESFHEDRPRKCAVQQRVLMKELQQSKAISAPKGLPKQEEDPNAVAGCSSKSTDVSKNAKKSKEMKRSVAELRTELDDVQNQSPVIDADGENLPRSEHGDSTTSCSSLDVKCEASKSKSKTEINLIKKLDYTDSDDNADDSTQTDRKSDSESQNVEPVAMNNDKTEQESVCEDNKLDSTLSEPDLDFGEDTGKEKKKKRSRSSSSSSSTSTSSSSSSTSSSSSSSEEDRKRKRRHKSKHSRKHSKKSRKSRKAHKKYKLKRTKRFSGSESEDESSSKNRSGVVKRNMNLYPGKMYRYAEDTPNVEIVRVHPDHQVFIDKKVLDEILTESKSVQLCVKNLVRSVYTKEALRGSTAQGYPNRVLGKKKLSQADVLPRLDPEGRDAILKRAKELEESKKSWRPRAGKNALSQAFTQAVKTTL